MSTGKHVSVTPVAGSVPFDNSTDGFVATDVQAAIEEARGLKQKAGVVAGASFSGVPKKFTVTFATAFATATYSVVITSGANRSWSYESRTTAGFTINANAALAFAQDVSWIAELSGETP